MRRRRYFIPKIFSALLLWSGTFYLITQYSPENIYLVGLFFLLLFFALGFTCSLILASKRYAFLLAGTLTIFLFLRFLKMANILNIILLLALAFALGLFLHQKGAEKQRKHFPQS